MFNRWKALKIFAKISILNVRLSAEYVYVLGFKLQLTFE